MIELYLFLWISTVILLFIYGYYNIAINLFCIPLSLILAFKFIRFVIKIFIYGKGENNED